jgi:hypothetical protein
VAHILATYSAHLILQTDLAEHISLCCWQFLMTGGNRFLEAILSEAEIFCFKLKMWPVLFIPLP